MHERRNDGPVSHEQLTDALAQLVAASHASELSEADALRLNELLEESQTAREIFLRMAHDTQSLRVWASAQIRRDSMSGVTGAGGQTPLLARPSAMPILPIGIEPTAADSVSAFSATQSWGWLGGWRGIGLAGAVLGMVAVALFSSRSGSPVNQNLGTVVAQASESFDPRTVRIDSGSARVTLPKVGYMLIDGPAEVELISPLRAKLNRGRIRVRVTEPTGHGFLVETPDGDVADLSTEFGLDVEDGKKTGVVVFDGEVDLRPGKSAANSSSQTRRLVGGEGVLFNQSGELDRIVSIVTGQVATFRSDDDPVASAPAAVIKRVSDNLASSETKKFYEIVPGGLREDALSYGDRPEHQWNGIKPTGLPEFLIGADYVKTFSDDKLRSDVEIMVEISRPATLYIFFDNQSKPPKWLESGFRKTEFTIGMDLGPWSTIGRPVASAVGAGKSIDHTFDVWERVVQEPGIVKLGATGTEKRDANGNVVALPYMYGFAAVALMPGGPGPAAAEVAPEDSAIGR